MQFPDNETQTDSISGREEILHQPPSHISTSVMDSVSEQLFSGSLNAALEQVEREGYFAIVELPFSENEIQEMSSFNVFEETDQNYFGDPAGAEEHIRETLSKFSNDESVVKIAANKIARIAQQTARQSGDAEVWVCIRSMTADPHPRMRWHTDGEFFDRVVGKPKQKKLAFCLLGQSTHLAKLSPSDRAVFNKAQDKVISAYGIGDAEVTAAQAELNQSVPSEMIVKPRTGKEAALFSVGCDDAAPHSEPLFTEPRIFVSIVSGSKSEIDELGTRWM